MERDPNNSLVQNNSLKESECDKSFVGKVKSIINNTPLSKWFRKQDDNRPIVRRRDEVFDDEDISEVQPPPKRVKLPASDQGNNCDTILYKEICVPAVNVSNNIFHKIPEPVAGPSGIKSHKSLNSCSTISANTIRNTFNSNELLNGHSDSEESTSGYSSVARIGSKEQVCGSQESSKQASPAQTSPRNSRSLFHKQSTNLNRSLFAERSLSPNMNTSLSSRRPNFNASTFGSPNFVDKTLSTKKIINSPFYNGKTIYGGASAYGRSLGRTSQDLNTSLRNSVRIKPINTPENGNMVLGKTARRILDTIEQYSSPINDAKKIPVVSRKLRQDGLLTKYTGANPYMIRETKGPSNKELQIPTVPDLLKMKARLQESTESVKQIAASSKSDLNTEYYTIHTREQEKEKHTSKMKTKVTSVRSKAPSNETVSEVNLTPVSLPITTLPKFDFVIPPPVAAKNISVTPPKTYKTTQPPSKTYNAQPSPKLIQTECNVQKEKKVTTNISVTEYKFSDPIVVAENKKTIIAINNFKFSDPPVCTKTKIDFSKNAALNFKMPENKLPGLVPNKKTNPETAIKTAEILKTGSVMDILGKKESSAKDSLLEKFKPAQGTWECSVCMIRNQPDKSRCAACETPKPGSAKQTEIKDTFSSQFKPPSDKWECKLCMVYNNSSDDKCVCCTTPKNPTALGSKPTNPVPSISTGFGDKFKPSSSTWECGTCMIRNKTELSKCAACETPNPKKSTGIQPSLGKLEPSNGIKNQQPGFGSSFKVKTDEWECSTCMVRNKSTNAKCQCCETPNPTSSSTTGPILGIEKDKKPLSTFNFGIDKAGTTSFTFGIPTTASVTLPKTNTPETSVFGNTVKPATNTSGTFSFGIPPSTQTVSKTTESTPKSLAEVSKPTESSSVLTTSNPPSKQLPDKLPEKTQTPQFKFGADTSTKVLSTNKEASVLKSEAPSMPTTITATDVNKPVFNLKPAATNGETSGTIFGTKPDVTAKAPPAASSAGLFNFVSKPAVVAAPLASNTQPSQSEPAKAMFKFGSAKQVPSFGSTNSVATTLNNGFGTTSTPSFGMSGTPSFNKPATNSTEIKPFAFGSTAKEVAEPASKVPMYSFGQPATSVVPTTTSNTSGFSYASTTTPAFNFSTGKTDNPPFNSAPASNIFVTSTSNTTSQNGAFNFGTMASSNNSQKAGFSFGAAASSTPAPASSAQPGFNFGGSAASFASPSGGFNFSGAAPTFNASAKPAFNFTEGNVTAFSAQPSADGSGSAPRKIKRAVRRTQR